MKSILIPKSARLIPSKDSRAFHLKRNEKYQMSHFKSYNDWFYFIHVDPYIRGIHAFGMMIGLMLFLFSFYRFFLLGFSATVVIQFLVGVFFFYVLPLISHYIYDGGTAKSTPDKFHSTLGPVIHINLMTLTGTYDGWLRKFIEKYPFTKEAWELEDKKL